MKFLVVEDELVSRVKMQKILSTFGECLSVATGQEALDAFQLAHEEGEPFDAVTVDINLPDMKGQDVVAGMRAWESENRTAQAGCEIRVIMVSAMSDGKNIMTSFRKGCEWYVTKPIDREKIEDALARVGIPA